MIRLLPAALLAVLFAVAGAHAQQWPSKPIVIITGFPTGAGTDIFSRLLAEPLSRALGQPVISDNRTGAGGNVGSEYVAHAKPDGYTLLLGTAGTHAINVTLYGKLPFDVERDFAPISLLADVPNILIVNPKVPAHTVQEFIALARAKPGQLNYGSTGNGASTHLAGELFKSMTKIDIVHVPYRGSPPAMTALLANEVQAMFHQVLTVIEQVRGGAVRPLGVSLLHRIGALPDVPTIAEAGVPGYESSTWYRLFGPAGMPPEIVERLNRETVRIIQSDDFKRRLIDFGIEPRTSTPAEFAAVIKADIARWRDIVVASGAKVD